ncbi:MAG: TerC/Alx family metal homeostasis membrane protein [Phycisphaerales bacterium]|nr:TerC/Alx family metal homeostasis membrane protein [Phycisphaerales bacterium]
MHIFGFTVPMETWAYAGFLAALTVMLAIDLGVLSRRTHTVSVKESLLWSSLWVAVGVGFSVFVYFAYTHHWLGLGLVPPELLPLPTNAPPPAEGPVIAPGLLPLDGVTATWNYLAGYVIEYALSVDNIFIIAVIFKYFATPPQYQHRVLFWGIVGVVVMRGVMIAIGAALLDRFEWVLYVFAGVLILSAAKMLMLKEEEIDLDRNFAVRAARRLLPFTHEYDGSRFLTRRDGRLLATPLLLVLLVVDIADAAFALDSIPAVFTITREPFLVFTSNMFAVLGLRSLFFAISAFLEKFRHLKVSLAFILLYLGAKIFFHKWFEIGPGENLGVIGAVLAVGVLASIIDDRGREITRRAFLGPDVERYAKPAFRQARRLVILVVGVTVVLIGIVMIVAPGPGLIVIPIGLAILASEFWWARRLLRQFKQQGRSVTRRARGLWRGKAGRGETKPGDH